jgi:hypothetical protein
MRSQLTNPIHWCWWTRQVDWWLCSNRQSPGALPTVEAPSSSGSAPIGGVADPPDTLRSTARPARQAPSPAALAPAASAQPPRSPPPPLGPRGFGIFFFLTQRVLGNLGKRETGEDNTLVIRVPETDRFGSSGIRVIRVLRNWNRSVPSSVSGNSVSGSGNSVRFRVFPNGTKKIKK